MSTLFLKEVLTVQKYVIRREKMRIRRIAAAVLALVMVCAIALPEARAEESLSAKIVNLKTEGRTNPVGVDTMAPAFSWQMQSQEIGAEQTAYQIQVMDEQKNVVWDSGTVETSKSSEIVYEGEGLQPSTAYTWSVAVTDQTGSVLKSEEAGFVTSMLDSSFDAWDGAQWIGAGELTLDAASKAVFHISADVQLSKGTDRISFVLGADDFRLENAAFNPGLLQGENYVRIEVDFSEATENGGVHFNAYRYGYAPDDDPAVPFYTSKENEELDAVVTSANQYDVHHVDIFCTASTLTFTMDGVELTTDTATVNSWGTSNTFPNLNSVGFAAGAGESAVFTNYTIENGGRFARGILLDETTGVTYAVFDGLEGITTDGNTIFVDGGEKGILSYADPSFAAAPMLRTEFTTLSEVDSAYLYLTAQGIYNFYINGQEVAPEEWLNPGSTEYDSILAYNMYEVSEYLNDGDNAMGAVLGEGWWTGMTTFEPLNNNYYGDQPALMAKLVIRYTDGSSQTIVTNSDSWSYYGDGPVRLASLFQGERYDATKEAAVEGWNQPAFDAADWKQASVIETRKQFSDPALVTRCDEPVHVIRINSAAEALGETKDGTGSYLYDMGENVSGVPVITIPEEYAKPGETLTIRFAEILYPELEEYVSQGVNGMLMVENLRSALVTDFYTMKEGENVFCPDLTFHGYRYVEITGLDEPLPAECIQMKVLSSLDAAATYESSNELTNQLFTNIVNSTTSNYISLPTDCPQRDERMGWTGDAQVFALSGSYVADTYNFMRQWMDTVRADCGPTGLSSQYCPAFVNYDLEEDDVIPHNGQSFGITWNCLVVTIPYNLYLQTGNLGIVQDNIDNIYTYVDHLIDTPLKYKNANKEKITEPRLTGETGTLCDHLARIPTDGVSLGNAVFIACLDQTAQMADALGDSEKAQGYRETAAAAREAWNELFLEPDTLKTRNGKEVIQDTQASYATPLRYGVISDANIPAVLDNYLHTIMEPNITDSDGLEVPAYTITTGFNATGNVLNALSDYGLNDTAYKMFESTEYASWLYPVTQGATSIWERWNGYTNELGFNGNNGMNSFNHYSFGAVYEWMVAYQLGICADKAQPGYQHFILQPTAGGTFTYAKGSYDSVYGPIFSGWTAEDGKMTGYDAIIPANTSATLYLPASGEIKACEGMEVVGNMTHNGIETIQIELKSGSWHFDITNEMIIATAA